jgi:hypothetical protein
MNCLWRRRGEIFNCRSRAEKGNLMMNYNERRQRLRDRKSREGKECNRRSNN